MRKLFPFILCLLSLTTFAQRSELEKTIKITGIILDQETGQALEYATLVLQSVAEPNRVTGGITDVSGKYNVEITPGQYNISLEYIGYKSYRLTNQTLNKSLDLGTIKLAPDVEQLEGIEVVAEKTTVELRLDKKVYNVGQDLTVKGGSVTDVLSNVPSVSVDVEGNISLRGNESVQILINGKPSALSGLSPEALRQLPADAIEKVEVITNPSARYDAEGTAGILNIILKQSKTEGVNGSVNAFVGYPDNLGGTLSLNLRNEKFNIFTNTTYQYRSAPGNALFDQENFNPDGSTASFQKEVRQYNRQDASFNTNFGFELFLDETSSITNSFVYGKSNGENTVNIDFDNFDQNNNPTIERNRGTLEDETDENIQYSVNYQKKFNSEGHLLTADYQYSVNRDVESSIIEEQIVNRNINLDTERTINDEQLKNQLLQFDYVLPFGKDNKSQFELGYRGTFNVFTTDFDFGIRQPDGNFNSDLNFSNVLIYEEYVNAAYTQLGSQWGKFNALAGLRMEASDIGINLVNSNENTDKDYINWFPSVFLGYEFSETEQVTLSYSKRLRRPRAFFINPFPSRSSNTNLFQGNPDLDPAFTDAYDLAYLKRWEKITFTTSAYLNSTTGVFQFVTQETGDFVEIVNPDDTNNPVLVPVQVRKPINLATDKRLGMEFTTTYTPKRNWRLTWNLNLFQQALRGDFSFINSNNELIVQDFDTDNFTWFTNFNSKIPLPGDIDFQTIIFYSGRQIDAQSVNKGILSTNLAFSKDVIKDKATLSFNVSDLFNSRLRRSNITTANVNTYSEFQWQERQFTLSFLYRFNQPKGSNKENRNNNPGGGQNDFEG